MEEKSHFESFELEVNTSIKGFLKEAAKWSYFIAIVGFVGLGFMVIAAIFVGFFSGLSDIPGNTDTAYGMGYSMGVTLFYLVFALIYFFPILYLFKFSRKMQNALKLNNNEEFKGAFLNLKSHYKFMGIFIIVVISLYILILLGVAAGTSLF